MKYSKFRLRLMAFFLLIVLAPMLSLWLILQYVANVESLQVLRMNIPSSQAERTIQNAIMLDNLAQKLVSDPDAQLILKLAGKTELADMVLQYADSQVIATNISDLQKLMRSYTIKSDVERVVRLLMAMFMMTLIIIGVASSVVLSRGISRPIMKLVEGTQEIAKGNLEYRVGVSAKDEIKLLVDSFNRMVDEMVESREKLKRAERIAAWRDAARKLAHEIKNPLTPIQLSMYRLQRNLHAEKFPELFEECYNMITKEVDGLRRMVEEFSQCARMPKPQLELCDINGLIQNILSAYHDMPEKIHVQTTFAQELSHIYVDEKQLRQVLHNLIRNAVDAMPTGGTLSVTTHLEINKVESDKPVCHIFVQDSGQGMSEEVQRNMFTPYFTTKEKGTGLGLAIVQQIIEEHDGTIAVESKEGVGTKIILSFPYK